MDLLNQILQIEFMGYGPKALSLYLSIFLYTVSAIYALILFMPRMSGGSGGGAGLSHKKNAQYSEEDLLEYSARSDEYERVQEPYTSDATLSELVVDIAKMYELEDQEVESLRVAALLHDVGQVDNCDFIQEERALRFEEIEHLKHHPLWGYEFVRQMGPEFERAALWVRWSHENWDGTGYPDSLVGEQIPIPARILRVVDAYCAMMQDRPHRAAMTQDEAIEELKRHAGTHFDPQMVQLFGDDEAESDVPASTLEV